MFASAAALNSTNVRNVVGFVWHRLNLSITSALAPAKAADTAARLFSSPPRFPRPARELELLATGTRFDVATPEGTIAAWRFGASGRPVVLMSHGWGGRGGQLRSYVPGLLEAGYQPVLFDHLGHGGSCGEESTLVHFINGLDAVANAIEKDAPIVGVIGHSLGAAALGAWLNQTRRVLRAVMIAPPTSLQRYSGYFARKLGISESVRRAMQERFERRLGKAWKDFELPQSVAQVRAAALVIHDTSDREVASSSGLALARAWPDARFVPTANLGHRGVLRDPEAVRDAVDFIANRVTFAPPPARGDVFAFAAPAPVL